MSSNILIRKIEADYLKKDIPQLSTGDSISLGIRIIEGKKERIQRYEGVVISKKGSGINTKIKIRNIFYGIGVEKTIAIHSPGISDIKVLKKGNVRRSKLFYLRGRVGKNAIKVRTKS